MDRQFKTLVIRMLTEMAQYSHKIGEKVKAMKSEIKENIQGTDSEGKETGLRSMIWNKRKKSTSKWNRMKKQKFKKNESLRNLWDNFKYSNI